jgi:hypothetical protein
MLSLFYFGLVEKSIILEVGEKEKEHKEKLSPTTLWN